MPCHGMPPWHCQGITMAVVMTRHGKFHGGPWQRHGMPWHAMKRSNNADPWRRRRGGHLNCLVTLRCGICDGRERILRGFFRRSFRRMMEPPKQKKRQKKKHALFPCISHDVCQVLCRKDDEYGDTSHRPRHIMAAHLGQLLFDVPTTSITI